MRIPPASRTKRGRPGGARRFEAFIKNKARRRGKNWGPKCGWRMGKQLFAGEWPRRGNSLGGAVEGELEKVPVIVGHSFSGGGVFTRKREEGGKSPPCSATSIYQKKGVVQIGEKGLGVVSQTIGGISKEQQKEKQHKHIRSSQRKVINRNRWWIPGLWAKQGRKAKEKFGWG